MSDKKNEKVHPVTAEVLKDIRNLDIYKNMQDFEGVTEAEADIAREMIDGIITEFSKMLIILKENIPTVNSVNEEK